MQITHSVERLTHHILRITDPSVSLPFYQDVLGMTLMNESNQGQHTHYYLQYASAQSVLELVHHTGDKAWQPMVEGEKQPGYWKIAIAIADVDNARDCLIAKGVSVGEAFEVPDVAYLCHFNDPDGYCIELIQHHFSRNHTVQPVQSIYPLGGPAVFSLVTLRVKDSAKSLAFYEGTLGMKLLSRQVVADRGFTLYFLACTDDEPPVNDIDAIENREWLWQRPYTVLELQHMQSMDRQRDKKYDPDPLLGFEGLRFQAEGGYQTVSSGDATIVNDPDGYQIHFDG